MACRLLLCAALALTVSSAAFCVDQRTGGPLTVIKVVGTDGEISYEVLRSHDSSERKKQLTAACDEALRAYAQELAAFKKDKANAGLVFERPAPIMPTFVVVRQNLKDMAAANLLLEELTSKHAIVKIKGPDGTSAFEAVQCTRIVARRTKMLQDYNQAVRDYKAEKEKAGTAAPNEGGPTRPTMPTMLVVQENLKDKDAADAIVAQLQAAAAKSSTGSGAKDPKPTK